MEPTQPTQTQPTQKSPSVQEEEKNSDHVCRLICTTGQYQSFDLNKNQPTRSTASATKKTWLFGRNADCDFVLSTCTRLSNKHFKLWLNLADKTLWIQDTSTNGTHLNGSRLVKGSNYIVNQGDEIAVGVGVPKDVIRFVVLFSDLYNPSNSEKSSVIKDEGIYKDFIIKNETIGQGAFATVKKVIERSTGDSYAVKIINRRRAIHAGGKGAMLGVNRELEILRKLDHPNIVKLKSFYEDIENYYLVMELVPGGDLMDFVAANGAIGEDATQVITRQVLDGIAYVHKLGISHRDLKPDNILIMQDDPILVKITDFGLAKISDNATFMKTFCGTLAYVAPEVITGKYDHSQDSPVNYSNLVDIWSLGCLVYVLLTSHLPFNGKTQTQMFQKIKSGEYHESPLNSYKISPEGRDFLNRCLQVDPRNRIVAEDAIKHPWLADVEPYPSQESQLSQKVVSLSQSTSQQSRKIENGIQVNSSMSKLDDDIMMRALDSDRNKKQKKVTNAEFKVPKRVIPLPQSQPLQPNSQNYPFVSPKKVDKPKSSSQKKRSIDELSNSPQKKFKADPDIKRLSISRAEEIAPSDTCIILEPAPESIMKRPIYIRQGVNPYAIGRNETCDTFINDDRMSKIHCLINKKRHPVLEASIYESPAHCLEDIWLLDFSTNSCFVNGVRLGKGRKVQIFNRDRVDFFVDDTCNQSMSFIVRINDTTGLFNGGEKVQDHKFVNVVKFDAADAKLRPPIVAEPPSVKSHVNGSLSQQYSDGILAGNGGNFNSSLRIQRKVYDHAKSSSQSSKRASLQSGQERPKNSWV
ncbi:putative serine threonine-kinase [Clavispora lusitaniae]|uniref:Serine/threonine-protein kinase RAD53 n=2 Tax=Clavispora lusitaniae TaxID=36911 RepID=C4Y319_CLAL4|nr:uncharacterized protein CLUG_02932 [Clavispora lusitaniae ATCC 42720]KAF7579831.1 Protein kinase domain family protein [Clavispora lusitaniae]EEQ38806.1 hypothetical protein CLUG_02932 [Clavispora lusitaniae ATCC 42720]QFZ27382.1 putative serine threonine-kinase [Clavispora lusitaniae]QFZ33310.1 putative serine threonine-kinase [Clavispora lusitaniae]QFZ38981.1 putative serine threonine-kinase [Clavispora lusitaniae]